MLKESLRYIKQEYLYCALLALAFSIPLSQYLSSKLLFISVVLTLFSFRNVKSYQWLKNSWDLLLFFTTSVVALLYSGSVKEGLPGLETRLSLLAVPFIFSVITLYDLVNLKRLFKAFILGLLIACFICLVNAINSYTIEGDTSVFLYYSLTNIINFQPTYFAYYLVFAITLLLFELYNSPQNSKILIITGVVFFFLTLTLTGGQTTLVSILFIFSFFIFKYSTDEIKSGQKSITAGLVVVLLIAMFSINVRTNSENKHFSDSWDRVIIWEAALKSSPNLFFGVGIGKAKTILNNYYIANNLGEYAFKGYNSHNQFIEALLENGVFGLLALMILLGRPLYLSFKSNNVLGILILYPFIIYGITEVFLGRYQGIVFYAILHQSVVISSEVMRSRASRSTGITNQST